MGEFGGLDEFAMSSFAEFSSCFSISLFGLFFIVTRDPSSSCKRGVPKPSCLRIFEKINLNNLSVVFYGAFILQFLDNSKINYYKKKYDIKKYYPIFLTVGDIKNRKGQLDTLRALNLLKDKYKNWADRDVNE